MALKNRLTLLLILSVAVYCRAGTTEDPTTEEPDTTTTSTPTPSDGPPTASPGDPAVQGSWNLNDTTRTCLMTKMGLRLGFAYTKTSNESGSISYDVPVNATIDPSSTCGANAKSNEVLKLAFNNGGMSFQMTFKYDDSKNNWAVTDVDVGFTYPSSYFPDGAGTQADYIASLVNVTEFQTPNGSSYQCVSQSALTDLTNTPVGGPTVNVTTFSLQVEAFRSAAAAGNFLTPIPCPADTEVSNIVPIAVGAALAGLVVIVLVAYLIGRKKSKRGYESV